MIDFEVLKTAMGDLEEETMLKLLNQVIDESGADAEKAMQACQEGMDIVGSRYESEEYFVSDLIYAGELMTEAVDILKSALVAESSDGVKARMILCTVKGDLHDIGKNVVKSMMEAAGFEVVDLGIDVAPEAIVEEAKNTGITIIGLSGVLTLAIDSMKDTVDAFKEAGMRDNVKIIIGGAPVTEESYKLAGADYGTKSPQEAVGVCKSWVAAS